MPSHQSKKKEKAKCKKSQESTICHPRPAPRFPLLLKVVDPDDGREVRRVRLSAADAIVSCRFAIPAVGYFAPEERRVPGFLPGLGEEDQEDQEEDLASASASASGAARRKPLSTTTMAFLLLLLWLPLFFLWATDVGERMNECLLC